MEVESGSYAETYAKNNKIPYSIEISGTTVNISCPANMTEEITVQFIRKSDGQVEKQEVVTPSNGSAQVLAAGLNGDYIVTFSSATYTASSVSLNSN